MQLKNEFLYDMEIREALSQVLNHKFQGWEMLSNIYRLRKALDENFERFKKESQDIVKQFAELDEKGEIAEGAGPGTFKIKAGQEEAFRKAMECLMSKTFEMPKCKKLRFRNLLDSGLKLSSSDIVRLEPIIEGLEF